jgi:hypothetical protein
MPVQIKKEHLEANKSKTDATGEGAAVYLSPLTMRLLKEWVSWLADESLIHHRKK